MVTKTIKGLTVSVIISLSFFITTPMAEEMPRQTILFHEGTTLEEMENSITELQTAGFVLLKRVPFINGIVIGVPGEITPLEPGCNVHIASIIDDQEMTLQAISAAGDGGAGDGGAGDGGATDASETPNNVIIPADPTAIGDIANNRPHGILKMMDHPYDPFEIISPYDHKYITDVIADATQLKPLKNIKMAVFDTGIDPNHPRLVAALKSTNIAGGIDLVNMIDGLPADDNGHGTHVSGTLIGDKFGLVQGVKLYMVKVLDENAAGDISTLIMALQWCIDKRVDIINMSIAYREDNPTVHMAIRKAHEAGIIMVAAVGNHSNWIEDEITSGDGGAGDGGAGDGGAGDGGASDDGTDTTNPWPVMYPAAYPEVIAVGAIDAFGDVAPFSNLGPEVDIMAPGTRIFSSTLNREFGIANGTSMACPHIAGAVALMKALDTSKALTPDMVKTIIRETTNPDGSLNLYGALHEVLQLQ